MLNSSSKQLQKKLLQCIPHSYLLMALIMAMLVGTLLFPARSEAGALRIVPYMPDSIYYQNPDNYLQSIQQAINGDPKLNIVGNHELKDIIFGFFDEEYAFNDPDPAIVAKKQAEILATRQADLLAYVDKGKLSISYGGWCGNFAKIAPDAATFVNRVTSDLAPFKVGDNTYKIDAIDLDIEGEGEGEDLGDLNLCPNNKDNVAKVVPPAKARYQILADAAVILQSTLKRADGMPIGIIVTLEGSDQGFKRPEIIDAFKVVSDAALKNNIKNGVLFNIMAFNLGGKASGSTAEKQLEVVLQNAQVQLQKQLSAKGDAWTYLGVTVMIGETDASMRGDAGEFPFTLQDAAELVKFVTPKNIAFLSYWNANRDNPLYVGKAALNAKLDANGKPFGIVLSSGWNGDPKTLAKGQAWDFFNTFKGAAVVPTNSGNATSPECLTTPPATNCPGVTTGNNSGGTTPTPGNDGSNGDANNPGSSACANDPTLTGCPGTVPSGSPNCTKTPLPEGCNPDGTPNCETNPMQKGCPLSSNNGSNGNNGGTPPAVASNINCGAGQHHAMINGVPNGACIDNSPSPTNAKGENGKDVCEYGWGYDAETLTCLPAGANQTAMPNPLCADNFVWSSQDKKCAQGAGNTGGASGGTGGSIDCKVNPQTAGCGYVTDPSTVAYQQCARNMMAEGPAGNSCKTVALKAVDGWVDTDQNQFNACANTNMSDADFESCKNNQKIVRYCAVLNQQDPNCSAIIGVNAIKQLPKLPTVDVAQAQTQSNADGQACDKHAYTEGASTLWGIYGIWLYGYCYNVGDLKCAEPGNIVGVVGDQVTGNNLRLTCHNEKSGQQSSTQSIPIVNTDAIGQKMCLQAFNLGKPYATYDKGQCHLKDDAMPFIDGSGLSGRCPAGYNNNSLQCVRISESVDPICNNGAHWGVTPAGNKGCIAQ